MAEVVGVVQKTHGRDRLHVEIDGPVHERGRSADGKDDGVHVVHGHGFDDHGFGAHPPVCVDVGVPLNARGRFIDPLRVLCCETEEGVCGDVSATCQRGLSEQNEGIRLTILEAAGLGVTLSSHRGPPSQRSSPRQPPLQLLSAPWGGQFYDSSCLLSADSCRPLALLAAAAGSAPRLVARQECHVLFHCSNLGQSWSRHHQSGWISG